MPEQEPQPLSWVERELDSILGPAYQWGLCVRLPDEPDPKVVEERTSGTQDKAKVVLEK